MNLRSSRGGNMNYQRVRHFFMSFGMTICAGLSTVSAHASSLNLGTSPLFVSTTVPPLTMLVMGRDHKLYYEAYNDASDLNGDGVVDVGYQGYQGYQGTASLNVDYYGYFNSYACYDYNSSTGQFEPKSAKTAAQIAAKDKTCAGGAAGEWSGDFLNYVTTARIDAMRKVFYGGKRSTDSSSSTVLERTHIPQDAHAWGKEYASVARDGFDISEYTNLSLPAAGTYHLLANVSLSSTTSPYGSNNGTPRLRVLNDSKHRVWEWLSKERPVAGTDCIDGLANADDEVPCSTAASNWSLVPSSVFSNLTRSFYNISGYGGHPSNNSDFINLENNYAVPGKLFGSDTPSQINGSGNPFGSDEYYMTIFDGEIEVPTSGLYEFAVDGDDAVEITINDGITDRVVGWYGGHGSNNSDSSLTSHSMSVLLNAGIKYTIKFRMEEATGGDSYYLYWKQPTPASGITDYIVRTQVCTSVDRSISHETNSCESYPSGAYKPVGLLHEFGEDDTMLFGLLSGSYENNLDGGVLRKAVSSFQDEVNLTTGQFDTSTNGIISTLDKLRVMNYDDSGYKYSCGWIKTRPITNGECDMWGNPVAEMMYESLRYFSGKGAPTADFNISTTGNNDATLGLPLATWSDPYDATTGYDECAKPFQIVVSDINPSYDSDKVPGAHSSFGSSFTGDITGLNAADLADTITAGEGNIAGNSFFIGQSGTTYDNAPTAKVVQSLSSIRGMAPEEPTKLGSYYAASMAYYGFINDINPIAGDQNLQTFAVALASPLPTIEIDPDNNVVTDNSVILVPFAKSPGQGSMWTNFQPTNQIVDFYVESLGATSGSFLINYEDVEQGADHDMDAIARYTYTVNSTGTVTIDVESVYAAGGIDQHMGYVISGTTKDGVYLEVKDRGGNDHIYPLDTPPGVWAGDSRGSTLLGLSASRTFTPSGSGASASFLKDPLWYATKWGGFIEGSTENDKPDITSEWDADLDGNPDNYFMVTNALNLKDEMEDAFDEILARSSSATTVAVSSGSIQTDTLLYRAKFNTNDWSGTVSAVDFSSGSIGTTNWEFSEKLRAQLALTGGHSVNREIITMNDAGVGVPFRFPVNYSSPTANEISSAQVASLLSGISSGQQSYGNDLVNYLRGDDDQEKGVTGATRSFRERGNSTTRNVLGDIVHSDPLYVVAPNFFYPDNWPTAINGNSATSYENAATQKYSDYRTLMKNREPVLYVGANDGMLHGINAYKNGAGVTDGGEEILAYVPNKLFDKLPALADENYSHQYYVDGKTTYADVFFKATTKWHTALVGTLHGGGQGVFALDISDPKGIASASGYDSFDEGNANDIALWEFTDADDADLGFTFGRPTIVRLANGDWGAVFGNGYDNTEPDSNISATGNSVIYIVNVETGALIRKFDTEVGMADDPTGLGRPNGMSEPLVIDDNGDGVVDYLYAGDLFGNMWKVDISSVNDANWGFSFTQSGNPAPFYTALSSAGDSLPITQPPVVIAHPKYGYRGDNLVFFGTGKYIEGSDNVSTGQNTQSFFGIWDDGTNGKTRAALLTQTIEEEVVASSFNNSTQRVVSKNKIYWDDVTNSTGTIITSKHGGWVLDLVDSSTSPLDNKGERSISKAIINNGNLVFTTFLPSDNPCDGGGSGWIMFIDANDGSGPETAAFDITNDDKFNNDDLIDTDGDGTGDTASAGFKVQGGVNSSVVSIANNATTKLIYSKLDDDDTNDDDGDGDGDPIVDGETEKALFKRLYWRELK